MDDLYEPPITRIVANVQSQIEEQEGRILMKVVHDAGFDVDKHELMKALAYDREQYKKGYADAMKNAVPLDKLCECLVRKRIGFVDEVDGKRLTATPDRALWATLIEEWMEGLDAAD